MADDAPAETVAPPEPEETSPEEPPRIPLSVDIVIGPDGEVIFTDLPPELLEVALALDPDSELACRRPPPEAAPAEAPQVPTERQEPDQR